MFKKFSKCLLQCIKALLVFQYLRGFPWPAASGSPIQQSDAVLRKSDYDTRNYSTYILQNGVSVISIQHNETPKSGYAAAVGAGSLYDPIETQGLAHLLEHMLFLGTKSHPGTSSYDDFLSQHGGSLNAWTADERTVFHNSVDNEYFSEALGRFSEFFTEPVLNGTSRKKEILAVDAEHQKNVPSDGRRMWATQQFLFSFPLNHFNTGNQDTLERIPQEMGIDIFSYLRKFHETYYCGLNIGVVTLSPLPLNDQKSLVESHFGKVDSTNQEKCKKWRNDAQKLPIVNHTLANSNPTLKFFHPQPALPSPYVETVNLIEGDDGWKNNGKQEEWDIVGSNGPIITQMKANGQYTVWLSWSLPPTEHLYAEKPLFYVRYMVGYGGRDSLEKDLIHRRWITKLDVDESSTSMGSLLIVEFNPTELGQSHLWDIIERITGYVNDVRDNGVDEEVLASLVKQSNVLFSVTEPGKDVGDTVADVADALLYVSDPRDVLTSRAIVSTQNATRIQEFLDLLMPERLMIVIADPKWERPSDATEDFQVLNDGHTIFRTDPFYEIDHTITSMPRRQLRKLIDATTVRFPIVDDRGFPQSQTGSSNELALIDLSNNATQLGGDDANNTAVDSSDASLRLAPPIRRLPATLVAFNHSSHGNAPEILSLTPTMELWWRGSGQYPTPRTRIRMSLRYSAAEVNLQSALAARLYCAVVNDIVSTKLADFTAAGYSAMIFGSGTAFNVQINGFNDNQTLVELIFLLSTALQESVHNTTETRYQRLRQELIDELSDVSSSRPTRLSLQTIRAVLLNNAFLREDILDELIFGELFRTYDTVASRVRSRLRSVHTTALTMGLSKKDTVEMVRSFLKESGFRPLSRRQAADSLTVDLITPLEISLRNPIPADSSNAALLLFRTDFPTTIEDWVETQILANMFGTKVMEQLRTVRQLGYIAGASVTSLSSLLRVVAYVEGPRVTAGEEMVALEEVMAEIGKNLSTSPESELQQWRMSLKGDLSVTLINSEDVGTINILIIDCLQEHNRLWSEIEQGLYCFQRQELQSKYLHDASVWNNSAATILTKAFERLTSSNRSVKATMHAATKTAEGESSIYPAFLKFALKNVEQQVWKQKELTLSSSNITEFQKHFGFLPIASVCALNRHQGTTT